MMKFVNGAQAQVFHDDIFHHDDASVWIQYEKQTTPT
jgi:hypothetical protein